MARAAPGSTHGSPAVAGCGSRSKAQFVFVDRLLATLVNLRHGTTHDVVACWFGVDRSTITRANGRAGHPAVQSR
ncbi:MULTISPECIES: helix-turn-helix domain-containing protein [Streptomyces]|uniref:helix-turn-helix domain-containing protein n=1 Tax=Streptomyces TaxID=1883 RepID=UPI002E2AF8D4|nr:transposase family protein [Streptomyces ureilyticus]